MSLVEKLKLLFKVKKPVEDAIDAAKEAKKSRKWFHFAVVLLGSLGASVAALQGVIPATAAVIASSALAALYAILRGADKADSAEIKGTFRTTEFWLAALVEVQKAIVAIQAGGISPEWLATASTIVGMALAAGQNLAARTPAKP